MKSHFNRSRRRGQALILAILVMILAALTGAIFVTVVSLNLNQTARQSDKSQAIASAKAGLDYVNAQLTYSDAGERWKPTVPATVPYYYNNAVENAQGWVPSNGYAKYPAPNPAQAAPDNAPRFLAKVTNVDPIAEPDKAGMVKIEVVGLSDDESSAWHRLVAYKGGYESQPVGRAMRVVTNWDFTHAVVPEGSISANGTAVTDITLKNVRGSFPDAPFCVMLENSGGNLEGAVVSAVTPLSATQTKLTLTQPVTVNANARVEMAASLGAPRTETTPSTNASRVDLNNDGSLATGTTEQISYNVSNPAYSDPGSVRVNGSLWWLGSVNLSGLYSGSSTAVVPGKIEASGLMAQAPNTDTNPVTVSGVSGSTTISGAALVLDSKNTNFPMTGGGTPTQAEKLALVSDGTGVINRDATSPRQVRSFTPPNMTSGSGLERYRNLSLYSTSVVSGQPGAAAYGFGEGIYINNIDDREKTYNGGAFKEMTQQELIKLWLSPDSTDAYERTGPVADINVANASLEESHARGWIGPDEFLPRGVLVELSNNTPTDPILTITRDFRTDNKTGFLNNATGPVLAKAWYDPTTKLPLDGVYRQVFHLNDINNNGVDDSMAGEPKFNGVVFADGNIRVRGTLTNSLTSLTLVSMNNIYIEGSLNAGAKKVMLVARKNVVANPTRVVSRVEAASQLSAPVTGLAVLPVTNAIAFSVGDYVQVAAGTPVRVIGVNAATNEVTVDTPIATAAANDLVRGVEDPLAVYKRRTDFARMANYSDILQRHFWNNGQRYPRLLFGHAGENIFGTENRNGLSCDFAGGAPAVSTITVKQAADAMVPTVKLADKIMRITHPSGTDPFDLTASADLTTFASTTNASTPTGSPVWTYNITPQNGYGVTKPWLLAGVGNRSAFGSSTTTFPFAKDVLTSPGKYPTLATSVGITLDNSASDVPIQTTQWGSASPFAPMAFGFQPVAANDEDVLTSDSSFYTNGASFTPDSRYFDLGATPTSFFSAIGLKLNQDASLVDETSVATPQYRIPAYLLANMKEENITLDATNNVTGVAPGTSINIQAYVYAQEGSWFVIPGPAFDSRIRGSDTYADATYYDFNNNKVADAGEYVDADASGTFTTGDFADINRNGIKDGADVFAVERNARYNYQITFTGAIAENHTALVNNSGTQIGAVAAWTDRWLNYDSTRAAGQQWQPIIYKFDPDYARGLVTDDGFKIPVSPDLIYES